MNTRTMITELRVVAEKHKNDKLFTFDTNISAMCNSVIPKLQQLEQYENLGTIEEFKENKNFIEFLYDVINPSDIEKYLYMVQEMKKIMEEVNMKKIDWVRKLTSRKLWMSIGSFVSMMIVATGGTENQAAQVAALIMAGATVLGYVIGEGLADASNKEIGEGVQLEHTVEIEDDN